MSHLPSDWDTQRRKRYKRDNYECQNCGRKGGPRGNAELHAHHIVPKSKGGTHKLSNLKTLCSDCHKAIHGDSMAPTTNQSEQNRSKSNQHPNQSYNRQHPNRKEQRQQYRMKSSSDLVLSDACPECGGTIAWNQGGPGTCIECTSEFKLYELEGVDIDDI